MYFFPHISCLDWPSCCRSGLPKPNVVYRHFVALQGPSQSFADHSCLPLAVLCLPGQLMGPALRIFADHSCSFPALFHLVYLLSAGFSGLLFGLVQIILFFSSCFSFGVAPFITIPILPFHLISHPLSLSGSFHFLRLASGPEPLHYPNLFLSAWQTYPNSISPSILINLFSSGSGTPSI